MKYLLVFAVLVVAYLLWRAPRRTETDESARPTGAPELAAPQDMVRCPVCAVHLPQPDALRGASGRLYCSPEHRLTGGN